MKNEKIDLVEFLPERVFSSDGNKEFLLNFKYDEIYINLSYTTYESSNKNGHPQEYSFTIPRYINKNKRTFEVLGLLQAEMGKTQNGCLNFCNSEPRVINIVLDWFEKEIEIPRRLWRWYIKINLQEPNYEEFSFELQDSLSEYWVNKTGISFDKRYPKALTFVKNTKNEVADNEGTLVIEYKRNLLSQVIKNFVRKITYEKILNYEEEFIRGFMRGIIAGEGTIDLWKPDKRYRVYVSVPKNEEKEIYYQCLKKLGINSIKYKGDKLVISKRQNNIQLLKQRLVTLSPNKYDKFFYMMQQYLNIQEETGYFKGKGKNIWNKITQEKTNKILELYKSGLTRTMEIANKVEVSKITVNRILRRNNLGKRLIKTPEPLRKEISKFAQENQNLPQEKIAEYFKVNKSVVRRACKKYNTKRGNKTKCKIPEEKIQRIIEIYKNNSVMKIKDICKEVGVSDSVVRRVRRENNLMHLGYKYLIGCNNKKYKANNNFYLITTNQR